MTSRSQPAYHPPVAANPQLAAPPALAEPWGGTSRHTDLGLPGRPPVHWVDFGGPAEPDNAPASEAAPMVLVHGLGGSHLNWVLVAPLLRRHRRVYALDLAGFGLTPGSEDTSTVEANAELLTRFVRTVVGRPVVLVGNSMGAMVSLLVAAAAPELVERLVLVDPVLPTRRRHLDRRVAATFAVYGIPRVGEAFVGQVFARMSDRRRVQDTTNLCFAVPTRVDPEVFEAAVALLAYRRGSAQDAAGAYLGAARSLMRVLGGGDRYRELMRGLSAPVLLIHGERDRLVPVTAAHTVAAENPGWTSVILPDVGHVPILEKPDLTAGIVEDWLAR